MRNTVGKNLPRIRMQLLQVLLENSINFWVASVPQVIAILQIKIFKASIKAVLSCLLLNLMVSIFFWVKLNDINLVIYQSIPYALSFIWLWLESVLRKLERKRVNKSDDNSQ